MIMSVCKKVSFFVFFASCFSLVEAMQPDEGAEGQPVPQVGTLEVCDEGGGVLVVGAGEEVGATGSPNTRVAVTALVCFSGDDMSHEDLWEVRMPEGLDDAALREVGAHLLREKRCRACLIIGATGTFVWFFFLPVFVVLVPVAVCSKADLSSVVTLVVANVLAFCSCFSTCMTGVCSFSLMVRESWLATHPGEAKENFRCLKEIFCSQAGCRGRICGLTLEEKRRERVLYAAFVQMQRQIGNASARAVESPGGSRMMYERCTPCYFLLEQGVAGFALASDGWAGETPPIVVRVEDRCGCGIFKSFCGLVKHIFCGCICRK